MLTSYSLSPSCLDPFQQFHYPPPIGTQWGRRNSPDVRCGISNAHQLTTGEIRYGTHYPEKQSKRGVRKAAVVVIVPQMLSQPRRDAAPLSAAAFPRCVSMGRHSAEPVNPICVAAISRGNIRRTDP